MRNEEDSAMSMVTSCTACHTTFRIRHEELQASHGRVRCGQCSTIFNALDTLATLDEPMAEVAPTSPATVSDVKSTVPNLKTKVSSNSAKTAKPLIFTDLAAEKAARQNRHTWGWFAAALLMLVLLAAQSAYNFRAQIAAYFPDLKPHLQLLCEYLQCTVGLPQFSELLSIESSDLQADPNRPSLIVLTAILRNRATYAQAYPMLELTFTDNQDHMIARRVFTAAEYLASYVDPKLGMQANSEFTVKLYIDSDDLKPAGYRLLLFYP
jgi:predicted Zn finger-like uncharacterized protein